MRAIRRFTVRTALPEPIAALDELALNLRWSWHPTTRDLFESMDPTRWRQARQDPVAMLGAFSPEELDRLAEDGEFTERVRAAGEGLHRYLTEPRWYQHLEQTRPETIAYFSMEFGIAAALPQYSGGLGILAGDHLKSASDLGVPIVAVGLFFASGYFKQSLTREGWQQETYPVLDADGLPLALVREADGQPATVSVDLPGGRILHAQLWRAQVGRVPLLLLDSNLQTNDEAARHVTDRLYGGTSEHRLQQEMLLGIGGVRALRLWSRLTGAAAPEVFHANEGHAGFLGLERISELTQSEGMSFDQALEAVRAASVFTTHTPVPAGIDRFGRDQIETYLGGDSGLKGVPLDRVLELGAETYPGGEPTVFNMAVMGLRLAQRANGVSQLHGAVSREMFDGLWPGFDDSEVPITSITNGVHAPTWVDRRVRELGERHLNLDALASDPHAWAAAEHVPDDEVWAVRRQLRAQLVQDARRRLRSAWLKRGASAAELGWVESVLDPDVLTIGFARRVPTYKRLTLMLRDPERLRSLLLHPDRPVQLVIAGKSHPADDNGKKLIQQMVRFADDAEVRHRIVFLPNYDIAMAQTLLPGCDVWLNNPLRPLEACGTSGMKAALNGCLNLSIRDGWWDEWYDGGNGWAIPTADGVDDPDHRDDLEADALYDLVEGTVAPLFYDRTGGLPARWLEMVRHTLVSLGPKVQATRMVADYTERLYCPATQTARALNGPGYDGARELAGWKARVRKEWHGVRVDHAESSGVSDSPQIGDVLHVTAFVSLGDLRPDDVEVQVVHGRVTQDDELTDTHVATLDAAEAYEPGRFRFAGELRLRRTGPFGYTVRVLPAHHGLASGAELGLVVNA